MRITLEPTVTVDTQIIVDPTEDKKFFLELVLPAYRKDILGSNEDPYPSLISKYHKQPPKAAKLQTDRGWICTYDVTSVVAADYLVKFPTYSRLWVLIQFHDLKVTIKGPTSVVVFKIPPPEGVVVDPETHQVQI